VANRLLGWIDARELDKCSGKSGCVHQPCRSQRQLPLSQSKQDGDLRITRSNNEVIEPSDGGAERTAAVGINASTATIYRHALDRDMNEATGELGGNEVGAPDTWNFSIDVAKLWEQAFFSDPLPRTRKVAIRSSMIFSADKGGVFDTLLKLVRFGLGGRQGSGRQYVSWIHEEDFARAVQLIIAREHLSGAVNVASPNPLPNREFMQVLRYASGVPIGLPVPGWAVELGALVLRTESELILKSRRVVPGFLLAEVFQFRYPEWAGPRLIWSSAGTRGRNRNPIFQCLPFR